MRRRLHALFATLILASGCVQATRHSNALIFGTNTSFGIQVGTSATQVPSIVVGYNRQEAVLVPVVANTSEAVAGSGAGSVDRLVPCNISDATVATGRGGYAVHPCSLVGINGKAQDSYSVLASFGAQFAGHGTTTDAKAEGGLAQYFATGVAAQMLALTGGASVIAVGPAAAASAMEAPSTADAIRALYGSDAFFQKGEVLGDRFNAFMRDVEVKIANTPLDQIKTKIGDFESRSGIISRASAQCTTVSACLDAVKNNYFLEYQDKPDAFDQALKGW